MLWDMCEKLWVPIFFDVCWYWVSWVLNSIDIGLVLNKASIYCLNTRLMLSRKTEPDSRRPGTFVCAKCALYFVTSLSFGGGLAVVVFIPCLVEYAWLCYSVCLFSPSSMWFLSLRLASCLHFWAPGISSLFDRVLRNIVLKSWLELQERKNTWSKLNWMNLGFFMCHQGLALDLEMKATLTWPGCGCETIGPPREQTISSCARAVFLGGPCEGKIDEIWEHRTLSWYDLPGLHEIHGKRTFKGRIDWARQAIYFLHTYPQTKSTLTQQHCWKHPLQAVVHPK